MKIETCGVCGKDHLMAAHLGAKPICWKCFYEDPEEAPMKTWIPRIIRYCLTLLMIYGAYTETGLWTALCLFGCYVHIECDVILNHIKGKTNSPPDLLKVLGIT